MWFKAWHIRKHVDLQEWKTESPPAKPSIGVRRTLVALSSTNTIDFLATLTRKVKCEHKEVVIDEPLLQPPTPTRGGPLSSNLETFSSPLPLLPHFLAAMSPRKGKK